MKDELFPLRVRFHSGCLLLYINDQKKYFLHYRVFRVNNTSFSTS